MKKNQENPWQVVTMLSSVGTEFVILTIGGAWIGRQLDALWNTKPIGLLIGVLLGLGLGFASAIYIIKAFTKE